MRMCRPRKCWRKQDSRRAVRQLSWEAPQSRDLCSSVLAAYRCREDPITEDGAIALEGLPVSYHRVHVQAKKTLEREDFNRAARQLSWEAPHIAVLFTAACSLPFGFIKTQLQQTEPDPFNVLDRASWGNHVCLYTCAGQRTWRRQGWSKAASKEAPC